MPILRIRAEIIDRKTKLCLETPIKWEELLVLN